jgi:glucose/arabinose dehydrogenase
LTTRILLLPALSAMLSGSAVLPAAAVVDLPDNYAYQMISSGPFTGDPVGMAILPDGRVLITERQTGVVRVVTVGSSSADSIFTVPNVEGLHLERGLLGVTVDPDWPSRPYFYFHYTHTDGTIKITMYTVSGSLTDGMSSALTLSSPFYILADIPDANGLHNGGSVRFGPDGMLYVSLGDDAAGCNAQDPTLLSGVILRLDVSAMPGGGSGPPAKSAITPSGNPFPGPNENEKLVWALGLRNPFRFALDPVSGDLFVGDVGDQLQDEISLSIFSQGGGENFGWPQREGTVPGTCCGSCGSGNTFTEPIFPFFHDEAFFTSVTAGPMVRTDSQQPLSFPPTYDGDYFFFEFFSGSLIRLSKTAGTWDVAPMEPGQYDPLSWGFGLGGVTDAALGPDGALYFLAMNAGLPGVNLTPGLHRVSVAPGVTAAPAVTGAERLAVVPNPARASLGATIRARNPGADAARLTIHDAAGRLVRSLGEGRAEGEGRAWSWNGRTASGEPAAPGVYLVRLRTSAGAEQRGKITLVD